MGKDEALRLALEALESTGENDGYHGVTQYFDEKMVDQAITAIKTALEAKDEPVAWMRTSGTGSPVVTEALLVEMPEMRWNFQQPLYTTPPQRTWVGLTDEEVMQLAFNFDVPSLVIRTVEHNLKEKNT